MESDIDKDQDENLSKLQKVLFVVFIVFMITGIFYLISFGDEQVYEFDCDGDGDYDTIEEVMSTENPIKPNMDDVEEACNFRPSGDIEAYDTDIDRRPVNDD
jgi:cell division protein FtsL